MPSYSSYLVLDQWVTEPPLMTKGGYPSVGGTVAGRGLGLLCQVAANYGLLHFEETNSSLSSLPPTLTPHKMRKSFENTDGDGSPPPLSPPLPKSKKRNVGRPAIKLEEPPTVTKRTENEGSYTDEMPEHKNIPKLKAEAKPSIVTTPLPIEKKPLKQIKSELKDDSPIIIEDDDIDEITRKYTSVKFLFA